jgi:hypothetical protein
MTSPGQDKKLNLEGKLTPPETLSALMTFFISMIEGSNQKRIYIFPKEFIKFSGKTIHTRRLTIFHKL